MLYGIYRKLYLKRLVKRGLTLGNNFQLEKGANIDAVFPKLIAIGNNVTLAKDVYVLAHDGSTKKLLNYTRCSKTTLKDNVFVGTKSVIMPGVTIGKNSIIGACSLVNKDVPAGEIWGGGTC